MISALAGGGLTAAALSAPLSGEALAASMAGVPVVPEGGPAAGAAGGAETGAAAPTPVPSPNATPTTTASTPTTTPTATTPAPSTEAAQEAPQVVLQRRQKTTSGAKGAQGKNAEKGGLNGANNNVAGSPQSIAQSAALAAVLASSQASVQALSFYRVPLFMLPIYKAAAVQYGIPWQILAAINEIETDFGNDQSVSSAGAEGWMQFMPATWLQYGVDALEAGYADPYNPVDAVFAAARYLRAAGAQQNMRGAILAYNHSEEYANSVILRAKLISTYPKPVVATLTGLVDGRLPVTGKLLSWGALPPAPPAPASTTTAASTASAAATKSATPGSSSAPTPAGAVAASNARSRKTPPQLVSLTSAAKSNVVAVQDGRVTQIGSSPQLGKFVVLRDVYGDEFVYAGLGGLAHSFKVAKPQVAKHASQAVQTASSHDPAPSQAATAGTQAPVTLQVQTPAPQDKRAQGGAIQIAAAGSDEAAPAGMNRPRLLAHPGNPDARAASNATAGRIARRERSAQRLPLRKGSIVTVGTVLGTTDTPHGDSAGHLRFAIRPTGDSGWIDPGPILANWGQLQKALHPRGATAQDPLLGATAGDVFLLSKAELQRTVLSDPAITIYRCGRQDIAAGKVDQRVLAVLAFLSRSGLQPTVTALSCGQSQLNAAGGLSDQARGDSVEISAINGVPLAHHQGPGTITDLTIRALLTLPSQFVPHEILSLMHYPGSGSTRALRPFWNRIRIGFEPETASTIKLLDATLSAHSATKGKAAPAPVVTTSTLTSEQWSQLISRIAGLPSPKVETKPTSAAIPDSKKPGS